MSSTPSPPGASAHATAETSGVIPALPGSDDVAGAGPAVRLLFSDLVDDAAVFPPGLAPLEEAVPAHLAHRSAWYSDLVGPFLVPAGRVPEFVTVVRRLPEQPSMAVAVIADAGSPDPLGGALRSVSDLGRTDGVRPVALEVPLPRGEDQGTAARNLLARLEREAPADLRAWVEVQRQPGWQEALRVLAGAGAGSEQVGAKLRTGGTSPQGFPSVEELAAFLRAAVDAEATFKLTAGLHTAVRGPDVTGAQHHGLLNVICGVRAALNGAEADEVGEVVAETRVERLASAVRRMSEADAAVLRAFFASFGCCGVTDPIGDLVDLGLLEEDVP